MIPELSPWISPPHFGHGPMGGGGGAPKSDHVDHLPCKQNVHVLQYMPVARPVVMVQWLR